MKHLLLAVAFFLPATSWAQYTPFQGKLYLQFTGLVYCYLQLADTANQQVVVQWPPEKLARVVGRFGNVGQRWFAITSDTTAVMTIFYVKASTLRGKAELVEGPFIRSTRIYK